MKAAIAAATAAVVALGLPGAAPARAETTATVKAQTTQRMNGPNTKAGHDGVYSAGQLLTLVCHSTGEPVKGFFSYQIADGGWDSLWYKTSDGHYVADVDIDTRTLDALGPDCGGGGGAAPAAAAGEDKAAHAMAWARGQMAADPDSTVQCEAFVEQAYNHAFRYPSAMDAFNDFNRKGLIHTNADNIPEGALVFTSNPGFDHGTGHVMLSEGNGQYLTANYFTPPHIREIRPSPNDSQNIFLGWAYAP
ncbi:hypothetical protein [Mycobacterium seoulense]|uniref:Uncharacterized protein n=1 Tax=Mycobacterium seoulense TaxID=386911 RepID=A0A7I7NWG7_9MYCO|nr:hypothetical protein [Mycobacterium seoulense]MCV7440232.1 hypothetical protein [Mycobacterium seoulense]BBY00172.1 hypothetical protein MSEO_06710 [Mycobacterium seoulense]